MSKARFTIATSLAERGWREQWVNEEEAACLAGMNINDYRKRLPELEASGFPQKNRWNGRRYAPAIVEFIHKGGQHVTQPKTVREQETFNR